MEKETKQTVEEAAIEMFPYKEIDWDKGLRENDISWKNTFRYIFKLGAEWQASQPKEHINNLSADWVKVEGNNLPKSKEPVLLFYNKGRKGNWNGQTGGFITQGYLSVSEFMGKETKIWYDYTDRQIQDINAKTSKNCVTHYLPILSALIPTTSQPKEQSLLRWVKASERLPEKDGSYWLRSIEFTEERFEGKFRVKWGKFNVSNIEDVEWLEELSSPLPQIAPIIPVTDNEKMRNG